MLIPLIFGGCALGIVMELFDDSDNYKKDSEVKNYRELKSLMGKGVILSENVRLSEHTSIEHILCVAPSGAGKTRKVVMHNVNKLSKEKCTIVATDPKYEIDEECNTGKKNVLRIAPLRPHITNGYDPLLNCRNTTEVRKIAGMIMANGNLATIQMTGGKSDNAEWIQKATTPFKAYMLYNYHTKKYSFPVLVKRLLGNFQGVVKEIMESDIGDAKILMNSFMPIIKAPPTFACILNTLSDCLELFLDDSVANLMSKPSIDLSRLRSEETVLYIQIPEKDSIYYSPLTSVFVSQLMDRLMEDKNGLTTYMMFDEFANIGKISSLTPILSSIRSRGISVTAFIQSLNQLELVYGNESKSVIEMFKTTMFMSGLKDSAEYASNLTGMYTNDTAVGKLLNSDQVRRLGEKDALIITKNKQPVVDRLCKIYKR